MGIAAPSWKPGLAARKRATRWLQCCSATTNQVSRMALQCPSDRKSTRLNSSHQIISYAVFCLKKKHTSELQSPDHLVCRLLLEKKKMSCGLDFAGDRSDVYTLIQTISLFLTVLETRTLSLSLSILQ